jgi:hypothetical protein
MRLSRVLLSAALLLIVAAHAGCSDDDPNPFMGVGAPCRNNDNCFSRCEEGFCTVECDHDGHCPGGWACIDEHGGICAPVCTAPSACGVGYSCTATDRRDVDGTITVCRH